MKRGILGLMTAGLAIWAGMAASPAEQTFDFEEVYHLLQTNLAGVDEAALERAATLGLIRELSPQVSLISPPENPQTDRTNEPAISRVAVYDKHFGLIRVRQFRSGLVEEFDKALGELVASNDLKGLVLDLRYSGGDDYGAAVAVADRFLAGDLPLMDFGEGLKKSSAKGKAVSLALAVLVNSGTSGAGEALAGALREAGRTLLLGLKTAGEASVHKEFRLSTGQSLRVAVKPVQVGEGKALGSQGVAPDVVVRVRPEDERLFFQDPYASPREGTEAKTVAVVGGPRRMNEAELVRMLRESQAEPEEDPDRVVPGPAEPPAPEVMRDPTLGRGIDLLKGLAVVQQFRPI